MNNKVIFKYGRYGFIYKTVTSRVYMAVFVNIGGHSFSICTNLNIYILKHSQQNSSSFK